MRCYGCGSPIEAETPCRVCAAREAQRLKDFQRMQRDAYAGASSAGLVTSTYKFGRDRFVPDKDETDD